MPKPDLGPLTDEECKDLLAESVIEVLAATLSHSVAQRVADDIYERPDD